MEQRETRPPSHHLLVQPDVKDVRRGTHLGFQDPCPVFADELADRALGIILIPEDARVRGTDLHARRLQPARDAVVTPGAFVRPPVHRVEQPHAVRAGLDAVLAADAVVVVDEHHAVRSTEGGAHRADLDARRVLTLVAELRHEERLLDLRVLIAVIEPILFFRTRRGDVSRILLAVDARFLLALEIDIPIHPGAEVVCVPRHAVFGLARLDATQTTDTAGRIHAEAPTVLGPVVAGSGQCGYGGRQPPPSHESYGDERGAGVNDGPAEQPHKTASARLMLADFPLHGAGPSAGAA